MVARSPPTVCPRLGVADHACGGKGEYAIESALNSFGEDVLFCSTMNAKMAPNVSLLNCRFTIVKVH
jgi:hypothetical protein